MAAAAIAGGGDGVQTQQAQIYENVSMIPTFAFGINSKAAESIIHVDTNHVMYPVGRYITVSALDSAEMAFLPPRHPSMKGVTCMAISQNRRYLAMGERTNGSTGNITLVNLQTMSIHGVFTYSDSREIVSLAFSGDGKYLAAQTGKPDWALVLWDWETGNIVSSEKLQHVVSKVTFNPWDTKFIVTTGRRFLQLWKLTGSTLQAVPLVGMPDEAQKNFSDHTWLLGDVLLVSTDVGELFVFERGTLKQTIAPFHVDGGISCLASLTKGVIAAGGNFVSVLESKEEGGQGGFVVRRTFPVPGSLCVKGDISCLSIPLSETNIVCSTTTSQLFQLTLNLNDMTIDVGQTLGDHIFAQSKGYHNGPLNGLDVAARKPLAVTTGSDCSVHVWNYQNKKCELAKFFKEDPTSVAVHPLGFQIVVGFTDKLKLCSLLVDDIRVEHGFPVKGCKEVRFSNGGQFVAAVAQNGVHIYSSITNSHIATLRGHVGQVKAIAFSRDDRRLVTVSIDGAIYEWNTQTWQRIQDNVVKTCAYTAVTYDDQGNSIICSASDKMLREIVEGKIDKQVSCGPDVLTTIAFSSKHRAVFAGTTSGAIRIFEYPLTGAYKEILIHAGNIARIRLSPGDESLFTAGEDGALLMFSVTSLLEQASSSTASNSAASGGGSSSAAKRETEESRWLDLNLAGLQWMKDFYASQAALQSKMLSVAQSVESEINKRLDEVHGQMDQQAREYEEKLKAERQLLQDLRKLKADTDERHMQETSAITDTHKESMKNLDAAYRRSLDDMTSKMDQQAAEKDKEIVELKKKFAEEKLRIEASQAAVNVTHGKELEAERVKRAALEQKLKDAEALFEAEIRQQEEEFEYSLIQAKENASLMLQVERDHTGTTERIQGQMRRRLEESQREQTVLKNQVEHLQLELEKAQKLIRDKEEEIGNLRRELTERSDTVAQKEGRLTELKQKNQELEKFRLVLEYKINELKEQIGPGEARIAHYKEQIQAMNDEFARSQQRSKEMKLKETEHAQKMETINKQLLQVKNQLAEKDKYVRSLIETLHRLYTETEMGDWKAAFTRFYQSYITQEASKRVTQEDQDRMKELARQREYMEHSLEVLKVKESRQETRHRIDLDRRTDENVQLIDAMNRLRRENKEMQEQIVELENKLNSGSVKAAERVKFKGNDKKSLTRTATAPSAAASSSSSSSSPAPLGMSSGGGENNEKALWAAVEQRDHTIKVLQQELDKLNLLMAKSGSRPTSSVNSPIANNKPESPSNKLPIIKP